MSDLLAWQEAHRLVVAERDALSTQVTELKRERDEQRERADANEMAMEMCGELRRILRDEFGHTKQPAFLCDAVRLAISEREARLARLEGALREIQLLAVQYDRRPFRSLASPVIAECHAALAETAEGEK